MNIQSPIQLKEGLPFFRFLMVLGSLAPLFLLLAVRGVPTVDGKELFSNYTFTLFCIALAALPTAAILLRVRIVKATNDSVEIVAGKVTDSREHLLVYLFALLIPMYQNSYSSHRDVGAAFLLLLLIVFVLYHLNLHYLNIIFAAYGYRVYTVETDDSNEFSGRYPLIVLSRRHRIDSGTKFRCYRISNDVYIER